EVDPPRLAAVEGEAEQVPVAVEDQRGAVERPVRRLVEHGRGRVEEPILPGVDVEHVAPAAPARGEGTGHGTSLSRGGGVRPGHSGPSPPGLTAAWCRSRPVPAPRSPWPGGSAGGPRPCRRACPGTGRIPG